jgi:hypothetical protein
MGSSDDSYSQKYARVSELVPSLIAMNLSENDETGIVIGFENLQKGDVLVYAGYNDPENSRLGHVSVIRDIIELEGSRFACIQHSTTRGRGESTTGFIQIIFVPLDAGSDISILEEIWENPEIRNTVPELASAYEYRAEFIEDSHNRVLFFDYNNAEETTGDLLHHLDYQNGGDVVFAVRTNRIVGRNLMSDIDTDVLRL